MNDILNNYFSSFLHPWHTQELLRKLRLYETEVKEPAQLELVGSEELKPLEESVGVNFEQSLTISWLFVVMNGFYVLIGHFMGLVAFEGFSSEGIFLDSFQSLLSISAIGFLLLKTVFFPLFFWVYSKFWINIIKIFSTLFEKDEDVDRVSEEIVTNAFTTHTFLVIPIFGDLLHRIANLVYLFGGLRKNLGFNTLQAGLVIVCPLLLFLFAVFMMALSVGMMASGL